VRELFNVHKGKFKVKAEDFEQGDTNKLEEKHKETIDAVLRDYGDYSSHYLSDLTHMEDPWKEARGNLPPGQPSDAVISLESMQRYYESLTDDD